MKQIPLTHGKFALVDEDDYYRIINYKWMAVKLFSDKFYARNQKFGLLSKFILKSDPNEELVVDFLNGDTLDYRKENLVKRKSVIKSSKFEIVKKSVQLSLPLGSGKIEQVRNDSPSVVSGIFEKKVYEAKHIDESGRVFHFGTYETYADAKEAYDKSIKMISD